jgi:hypothetical protein
MLALLGVAMTSNSDDLEAALQQNLKLRRELGAEVAKAKSSGDSCQKRTQASAQVTTAKARQETEPRAMFWLLIGSLTLAVIAALALGMGLDWIP